MSRSNGRDSHSAALVRKGWLITAAVIVLAALGMLVWFTLKSFAQSGSDDSVKIKKSEISASSCLSATSRTDTSAESQTAKTTTTEQTSTVQTTTAAQPAKIPDVKLDPNVIVGEKSITLIWTAETTENVDGYFVYRENNGEWMQIAKIEGAGNNSYEDAEVYPDTQASYNYKVSAFRIEQDSVREGKQSNTVSVHFTKTNSGERFTNLYLLKKGTQCFYDDLTLCYKLDEDGYYTGIADSEKDGYIRIDFMLNSRLVKASDVKQINDVVALPTSAIGQEGGQIFGSSACGPTAASVIIRYDKGELWDKDELIRYTEKNKLADQGSMMGKVGEGGMSAPMVIKLIESYSNGTYTAKNVYTDSEKPSETLKKVIDSGKHSILSVRYAWGIVHHPYSIIHFVEPSAYAYENGKLYFYYVDTAYGNGPKGLVKVEASELDQSVATVDSEPKCIIVLDGDATSELRVDNEQN